MGTFAGIYKADGAKIPDDKREEFDANIKKLLRAAGFLKGESICMYGESVTTIYFPRSDSGQNLKVAINFFEDDAWENAGFYAKECRVSSGKIGSGQFNVRITAAYMLEAIYTDGPAVPEVDGLLMKWSERTQQGK